MVMKALNYDRKNIGDVGAKELAAKLVNDTTITDISLKHCGIGNVGATALLKALQINKTVTTLNLDSNRDIDVNIITKITKLLDRNIEASMQNDLNVENAVVTIEPSIIPKHTHGDVVIRGKNVEEIQDRLSDAGVKKRNIFALVDENNNRSIRITGIAPKTVMEDLNNSVASWVNRIGAVPSPRAMSL
jgi:hypothetical protein